MGKLKILIIDDEPIVARVLGRMIRDHDVTIETDVLVAVARLQGGEPFDVIVCDRTMPALDGLEVLRISRLCDDAPIFILISGAETVVACDADGVLVKPFRTGALLDLIARLVAERLHVGGSELALGLTA